MSIQRKPSNVARDIARQMWPKPATDKKEPKRLRRNVIRQLRAGERVPEGEPKRYRSQRGYIRLRWLVGPQTYVEVYEHRVFDGIVTNAEHVHHINGDKTDNRPENLERLTSSEHGEKHGAERERSFGPYRSRIAMEKAQRAEANRAKRKALSAEMRVLYEGGATIVEIAQRYGIDNSGVSRRLRQAGARMRQGGPNSSPKTSVRSAVQSRAQMSCERCAVSVVWSVGEVHHRRNRSQGGGNTLSNLVLLCRECHQWITEHPISAHDEGFHVRHGEDPARTPIVSGLHGRVLIADDGSIHPSGGES